MPDSERSSRTLHAGLFGATCITTFLACYVTFGGGVAGSEGDKLVASALFSFTVMAILAAHEFGHYLMARAHGVASSLPYFIPVPLGFGTLGAVIRLKGKIPSRNALVDIGAAGPLCGLLIAVPMLFVGVRLSPVVKLSDDVSSGLPPALSLIHLAQMAGQYLNHVFFDGVEPSMPPYTVFGDDLLTLLAVRVVKGPLPAGMDLEAHPVFLAAWFGLVMTMLNLIPAGQLDGGHLTYAWYGDKAQDIGARVAGGALIAAFLFSASWLLWFFVITRFVGLEHPPVSRPDEPLSPGRKVVVVVTWVMTGLTFMPIPMSLI